MMGWEEPLSKIFEIELKACNSKRVVKEHVRVMTDDHPRAQPGEEGICILNVGYGLGIVRIIVHKATRSTDLRNPD